MSYPRGQADGVFIVFRQNLLILTRLLRLAIDRGCFSEYNWVQYRLPRLGNVKEILSHFTRLTSPIGAAHPAAQSTPPVCSSPRRASEVFKQCTPIKICVSLRGVERRGNPG